MKQAKKVKSIGGNSVSDSCPIEPDQIEVVAVVFTTEIHDRRINRSEEPDECVSEDETGTCIPIFG